MYPDLYLRLCFSELYSITFQFPASDMDQTNESFQEKQKAIIQSIYSILLSKPNVLYTKQSRRKFYIENDDIIIPNLPIRVCYIEKIEWNNRLITSLQVSLCTSFLQDHHYTELIVILSTDKTTWKTIVEEKITQCIKEYVL